MKRTDDLDLLEKRTIARSVANIDAGILPAGFINEDILIHNPYLSSCEREDVDPYTTYGQAYADWYYGLSRTTRIPHLPLEHLTKENADAWLKAMYDEGLAFHLDDNPETVVTDSKFTLTIAESDLLARVARALTLIPDYDPFATLVELNTDEPRALRLVTQTFCATGGGFDYDIFQLSNGVVLLVSSGEVSLYPSAAALNKGFGYSVLSVGHKLEADVITTTPCQTW